MVDSQMASKVSPPDNHPHAVRIWAFECVWGTYPLSPCWWHGSGSAKWLEGVCGPLNEFTY